MVGIPLHPGKGWGCFGVGWVIGFGGGEGQLSVYFYLITKQGLLIK